MSRPLPPLTWFRTFESAARHLSFTAAAAEIGLTQSAVSQQIKALETQLRVALFVRQPRGLRLTDEGRKLLPQVESALETLVSATAGFETTPQDGLLTVWASVSVMEWVIAPNLRHFHQAYPGLKIRFLSAIWPDEFNAARADVEVRFGSEKQAGSNFVQLLPNDLIAVKSPKLQGTLAELPLIGTVGTSRGWKVWCAEARLPQFQPTFFADSYGLALQFSVQRGGVALVSSLLTGHALRTGALEQAHAASIPGKEGYFLSVNKPGPAARAFAEWLHSVI